MTKSLSETTYNALKARRLVARDLIWFIVRDRETGNPVTDGYWSDIGTRVLSVIDPETGGAQDREFFGAAGLISISNIPQVSTLTVQQVTITLSQVSGRVNDLMRTYDCKQGRVQIFRGLFDSVSRNLVGSAFPRFVGFIDEAPITTPAAGEQGDVTLTCTSHTQELTRSNPDTRSDASQRLRNPTDNCLADVATVKDWKIDWGRAS